MPKSENSSSLMLPCSFTCPLTGKKCLNQSDCNPKTNTNTNTSSASSYCSSHLIVKCTNKKDVDLNLIQSNLEEQSGRLIRRLRHLQGDQLREHISKQLSAFVRHQQEQLNFTCQHPQFISRDHYSFDKNLVLSALQPSPNIHNNSIHNNSISSPSIKNLPTSQIVKLVKKSQQQQQQQQQDTNHLHPLQPPSLAPPNHLQPINCLQNNNLHNLQPPVASPIAPSNHFASKITAGEPPIKQQPYQISNPTVLNHHIHIKEEPNEQLTGSQFVGGQFNSIGQFVPFSPVQPIGNQSISSPAISVKDENKSQRKSLNYSSPTKLNNSSSSIVVNRKPLAPKFTPDQIKQINTTTGILRSNLKHFEHSYDSDATDSSSGGESCDELDDYVSDYVNDLCKQEKLELNSLTPLPLNQKSNWKWALERGAIACRWSWLEAQIGDLDFKIRQQNELYKQFRAAKGQISFYSTEPLPPPTGETTDQYSSCMRTLPLKEMKKRKLVRSAFILANSKATSNDVKPNVLCSCSSLPAFAGSCVLCNDRYNYVQAIDTNCMPVAERVALLDAGYHIVTSLPENVSLGLHFSKLLKKEIVHRPVIRNAISKKKKICPKGELGLKYKNDLGKKKKSQALIQSTKLKKKYEGTNKKQLLNKKANKVRLSKVSKDRAGGDCLYADENSRHDSPLPFAENGSITRDSLSAFNRRRRSEQSNAYDINNIVIPYSIASTTRVERLQYKEIITPEWRVTEEDEENAGENHMDVEVKQEPMSPPPRLNNRLLALPPPPPPPVVCKSPEKPSLNRSSSTLNKLLLNSLSSPEKMDTSEPPVALLPARTTTPPPALQPTPSFKLERPDDPAIVESLLNCSPLIANNRTDHSSDANNLTTTTGQNNNNAINDDNSIKPPDEDSNMSASTELSEEHKSDSLEDLSDETFIERHLKCEADEKKRFSSYLKNPLGVGSRGSRVRQRTESTKSETITLEPSAIDGSSQDSFSNMQIHNLTNSTPHTEKANSPDSMVFEEGSNQSTSNKIRSYSLSSRRDDLSLEEENYVEVIPYEKRNFPLNDNELNQLTMYLDNND